jgi:hypothetical protein
MPWYSVNATVTFAAWVTVEADTPEDARELAEGYAARDFEFDPGTAEVEFNVTPEVELAP